MTKINHDRPALRLLDNYRRELKRQAATNMRSTRVKDRSKIDNSMPSVDQPACDLILSMLDAADEYFDKFSDFVKSIDPNAAKSYRKKQQILKQKLETAENELVDICVQLIIESVRETLKDEHGIATWLNWFEKEAQKTDDFALRSILEVGLKPAFEKVDTAANEI